MRDIGPEGNTRGWVGRDEIDLKVLEFTNCKCYNFYGELFYPQNHQDKITPTAPSYKIWDIVIAFKEAKQSTIRFVFLYKENVS